MRALPLLLAATAAQAGTAELDCLRDDGGRFTIMLAGDPSSEGFNCVFADELRDRVPFCAPDGGWAVSDPGSSAIQFAADNARDLAAALAEAREAHRERGWLFARVGPSELVASASVGTRPPYALEVGGETFWRLRMTLATGAGSVFTPAGEVRFACEGA